MSEYQLVGNTIAATFSRARAAFIACKMYVVHACALVYALHASVEVTQGLTQDQPPADCVHDPELKKFGLGAMLTLGFVILVTAGDVTGGVVIVVVDVGVLIAVGVVGAVGVEGVEFFTGRFDLRDAAELLVEFLAVVGVCLKAGASALCET